MASFSVSSGVAGDAPVWSLGLAIPSLACRGPYRVGNRLFSGMTGNNFQLISGSSIAHSYNASRQNLLSMDTSFENSFDSLAASPSDALDPTPSQPDSILAPRPNPSSLTPAPNLTPSPSEPPFPSPSPDLPSPSAASTCFNQPPFLGATCLSGTWVVLSSSAQVNSSATPLYFSNRSQLPQSHEPV